MSFAGLLLADLFGAVVFPWWVYATHPERLGRGRLLTRPLVRLLRCRLFVARNVQMIVALALQLAASAVTGPDWAMPIYGLVIGACYLDDLLTGDDDRWKRFKDSVRNKVKWRMKLPQPVRRPAPAGA